MMSCISESCPWGTVSLIFPSHYISQLRYYHRHSSVHCHLLPHHSAVRPSQVSAWQPPWQSSTSQTHSLSPLHVTYASVALQCKNEWDELLFLWGHPWWSPWRHVGASAGLPSFVLVAVGAYSAWRRELPGDPNTPRASSCYQPGSSARSSL